MKRLLIAGIIILISAASADAVPLRQIWGQTTDDTATPILVDSTGRLLTSIDSGISLAIDTVVVSIGNLENINSDMKDNLDTQTAILLSLSDSGTGDYFDSGYFVYSTVGSDSKSVQFVVTERVLIDKTSTYTVETPYYDSVGDDRNGKIYGVAYIKP